MQHAGWVLRRVARWDEAMELIDRAIQLDPRNPTLVWNQGLNNYRLRRFGTGSRQFDMALDLDAGGPIVGAFATELRLFTEGDSAAARRTLEADRGLGAEGQREALTYWLAYMARDYDRALELARGLTGEPAVVLTSSTVQRSHSRAMRLALAYRMAGDEQAARVWADSAVAEARATLVERPEPVPWDRFGAAASAHAYLGLSLALRGDPGDAEEAVREAEEAVRLYGYDRDSQDSDTFDWLLLRTYVLTGRADQALAFMGELLSRPSVFGLGDLKLDPLYDELRQDPRFEGLIRKAEAQIEW
jgi:tetratricopeptide (TPR) repeat protein